MSNQASKQKSSGRTRRSRPAEIDDAKLNRLGPNDWIKAAIEMLAQDNVETLRVDEVAEKLGVTKGSFYWHFTNREDLLDGVLKTWRKTMTTDIQRWIRTPGDPWKQIENLLKIAISPRPDVPGGPFELTLRHWARRDKNVAKLVKEVDDARVDFVSQLYRAAGLGADSSRDLAEAQMAYVIGSRMTIADDDASYAKRRRLAESLFLNIPRASTKKR